MKFFQPIKRKRSLWDKKDMQLHLSFMPRLIFLIFFSLGFLYFPFLIHNFTLGFHPANLQPRFSSRLEWEGPALTKEQASKIESILHQPFTYLDLGSQSYAFESQDKNYVLKLFRYNRSQFSFIHCLKGWFHRKKLKSNLLKKIDQTFRALLLAHREAADCTQILYVHLNPTRGCLPNVTLQDPIGRKWVLSLDRYRFALQSKAEPFKSTLKRVYESKNQEEMKQLLESFIALLYRRTGKGIRNSDPNYGPNFGFYRKRAIEIDCGNYRKNPQLLFPESRIEEMDRFNKQLFLWLVKHAPEYSSYFYDRYTAVYEKIRAGEDL